MSHMEQTQGNAVPQPFNETAKQHSQRSNRKRLIISFSIIFILVLLCGSILYYFSKIKNSSVNIQKANPAQVPQNTPIIANTSSYQVKHWIISENAAIGLLDTPDATNFINAINSPNTYEIVHEKGKTDPLPNATHVLSFQSYQAIKDAFAYNKIPANIKVILYDNEKWPGTPINEQQHPFTYVPLAEQLVHQHRLLFMNTPAADLKSVLDPSASDNYKGYLQEKLAKLAQYTDIFEIQAQNTKSVSDYTSFSQQAITQAREANPNAVILLGITAKTNGLTSQDLLQEVKQTKGITDGYWFNIIPDKKGDLTTAITIALPVIQSLPTL